VNTSRYFEFYLAESEMLLEESTFRRRLRKGGGWECADSPPAEEGWALKCRERCLS
jgi:hypothetical protein